MYYLRLLEPDDDAPLAAYFLRNREFHREWSPLVDDVFYTTEHQRERLDTYVRLRELEREYRFGIFYPEPGDDLLIGVINLTNIVRGVFQNGCFGYSMDNTYTGGGIMSTCLREAVEFAFHGAQLHRVEANIMPRNTASRRVLEKAGFRKIGFSPNMLYINGVWEDHDMYAVTVEEFFGAADHTSTSSSQ